MGIKYIHLIRHGQYHTDKQKVNYGQLTSLGRYQAKRVGKRLAEYDVRKVFVSTMIRAQETADSVVPFLVAPKAGNSNLLVEGIPEFPDRLIKKYDLKKTHLAKTKSRMNKVFKRFFTRARGKDQHIALVCHGNVIRYFVTKALGVSTAAWTEFDIYQCSLSTISIDESGRMKVVSFGEVGHIPTSKRTFI